MILNCYIFYFLGDFLFVNGDCVIQSNRNPCITESIKIKLSDIPKVCLDLISSKEQKFQYHLLGITNYIQRKKHYMAVCYQASNNSWWVYDDWSLTGKKFEIMEYEEVAPHVMIYFKRKCN